MAKNVVVRSVKIPMSQAVELDLLASKAGVARNQILKQAITEFLNKKEKPQILSMKMSSDF